MIRECQSKAPHVSAIKHNQEDKGQTGAAVNWFTDYLREPHGPGRWSAV